MGLHVLRCRVDHVILSSNALIFLLTCIMTYICICVIPWLVRSAEHSLLHLQSKSQEKNVQHSLSLSARGLSPMTPFVDAPDKFRWRWVNLDNARLPSNMSVTDSINLTTLPPMIRAVKAGNMKIMQELIRQGERKGVER